MDLRHFEALEQEYKTLLKRESLFFNFGMYGHFLDRRDFLEDAMLDALYLDLGGD